jgi:sugar lactone lactonase YvrE
VRALAVIPLVASILIAQDLSEVRIETVATGLTFVEGPVWSRDGYLLISEIPLNRILKLTPGEPAALYRENSNGANGNTFDAQGRLYTCESHTRRVVRTAKNGKLEVLADAWQGKRLNAPNDIVVRKDGQIYFTDPAFGNQQDTRELDFYGVFHLSPKTGLEVVAKPHGRPNGIALSPDGHILYVANSDERNIRAYDLDKSGAASNERVLISNIDGVPDGLRTDEQGNLYVAAAGILVYASSGKLTGTIPIRETPANCAFGDPDLRTLYITARTSVFRVRLDVKGSVQY